MNIEIFLPDTKNPWKNLAAEEYLLTRHEKNKKNIYLLFYENLTSAILGRSLKLEEEVFSHKRDIPILRRLSGGGSVLHLRGNLNYSLILSLDEFPQFFPIQDSYGLILDAICQSFKNKGIHLSRHGLSDLCLVQKGVHQKISGNSQVRKKGYLMHHGTFLYDIKEKNKISYYLKMPLKQPEYREQRSHDDFVISASLGLGKSEVMRLLIDSFTRAPFAPLTQLALRELSMP